MSNHTSAQENDLFVFGITDELRKSSDPVLDMALVALTNILKNEHLQRNFGAHFLPIELYQYEFPENVPESVLLQMKQTLSEEKRLPKVIFQEDSQMFAMGDCSIYGVYNGRSREEDEDIIYVNKDILVCSKLAEGVDEQVKYASLLLFTIVHELGHWAFFKYGCNLNEEKHTPCGVLMEESGYSIEHLMFGFRIQHYGVSHPKFHIDDIITKTSDMRQYRIVPIGYLQSLFEPHTYQNVNALSSIRIPKQILLSSRVLDEELMKFHGKRVFDPNDDPQLNSHAVMTSNKRIFEPCDKRFSCQTEKRTLKR